MCKKDILKQTFTEKANIAHNNFYDYSLVEYKNNNTPVKIICPIHGEFYQRPRVHVCINSQGFYCGCELCSRVSQSQKTTLTNKQFIEKANVLYSNKYSYEKLDYKGTKSYVTITCPIHGDFQQRATNHLEGKGCIKCGRISMREKQFSNLKEFLKKAKKIHGDRFDYSKSVYIHTNEDCKEFIKMIINEGRN